MSLTKPLMTITTLAVAGIFGGGVYMMMNMDTLAERITERLASEALGVTVSIDALEVSLQDKRAQVNGLSVANPAGFKKPNLMTVDRIEVRLDKISQQLLNLKNINVEGTRVNVEVNENGTNLHALRQSIESNKKPNQKAVENIENPMKIVVQQFVMADAQVNPSVTLITDQDLQSVKVPTIRLTDIGEKENGLLVREAIGQIWTDLSKTFAAAASNAGFYEGLSADVLQDIGVSQFGSLKTKLQDNVDSIGSGIKGLFGN